MEINHVVGDATQPVGEGPKLIVHVCNDVGAWGRGFVLALSKRWPVTEQRYRAWHSGKEGRPLGLGEVQIVQVANTIWVANLIGQRDIRTVEGVPPVRYEAIREGMRKVALAAERLGASVHMPRVGCGLAGGKWEVVAKIIEEELIAGGIPTTVYTLRHKLLCIM
jgi:O-acetyl-ADP-ribose deacetylase (regulator of RNase III)